MVLRKHDRNKAKLAPQYGVMVP